MSLALDLKTAFKQSLETTPGYLAASQAAIAVTAILFFLAAWYGIDNHRTALKTVCSDTAPSIVAAQHIKAALADLDANAANEFLMNGDRNSVARQGYDHDRADAHHNLIEAAKNITYGDAEQKPIETIQNGLADYEADITRARLHHEANDNRFFNDYLQATQLMHGTLLPAAEALDKANREVLDGTYEHQRFESAATVVLVGVAGALLLFTLARTQLYLSTKTRRTLNQGMVGATAVAIIIILWSLATLVGSGHDLKWAKEDSFDSVSALWKARATAYDANGAESRWLLAKNMNSSEADGFEKEFVTKSNLVASIPTNETYTHLIATTSEAKESVPAGFTGDIADELRNITFPGELRAAHDMLQDWGTYMAIDTKIRALENQGQHDDAVTLCCGTQAGQSNWAFDKFDKDSLDKTLNINWQQFEEAYATGLQTLSGFEWIAAIAAGAVIGLTVFGLRPRFSEYKV